MAGIFLSYDRDDAARARPIALALEKAGHSVWWDLHVRGGAQFGKVIEEALKAADAVVVLWSRESVDSPWVRDEAAAGRDAGRLVPVALDGTEPPLGFRQFQTIDFSKWKGRGKPAGFDTLLQSISELATGDLPHPSSRPMLAERVRSTERSRRFLPLVIIAAAVVLLAVTVGLWRSWNRPGIAAVGVRAADPSAGSQAYARDLLVQLGELRPVLAGSMRLMGATTKDAKPDLLFQAAAIPGGAGASLVLTDANDELLWSKQFDDPKASAPDRRQQIAFTAARVLRCAIQESSGRYGHLTGDTRQAFLDACAASAEIGWDMRSLVLPLRKVTQAAPKFRPAWAQLLMADVNASSFTAGGANATEWHTALTEDLASARRRFPDMAEVMVAEYAARPDMAFIDAVKLLDKAKAQDPNNPFVLQEHAILMASVGRVRDSIDDNQRAAELDPISPAVRSEYIRSLAYGGQVDQARAELQRAKQLWPGTATVREAENSIELRYGDYEKLIRESGNYNGPGPALYVTARKNPTDANVAALLNYLGKQTLDSGRLAFGAQALGEMNRVDEFYRFVDSAPIRELKSDPYSFFRPWLANARRDRRFMRLAKRIGLVDYWQQSQHWPDFCSEPGLQYDCRAEAAKLK